MTSATFLAQFAAFCHRAPSAVRLDSVRRPIGFRSPPDRIPFAVRSDSVRCPMVSVELLVCANRAEKCRYVTYLCKIFSIL